MIEEWEILTRKLTEKFLRDYFYDNDPLYDWVSNKIAGVFNYVDYWFSFDTVLACNKMGITKKQLISWYEWCLENQSDNISLARYIESPKERKEAEEKYLKELEERVEIAEKEFKKAIENYTEKK